MNKSIFNAFGLRENPFSVTPDPRHLFLTRQTRTTLDALIQAIQARQGLMLLTGDVGTGKTTLINSLLDWLQRDGIPTAFVFNSHIEARELIDLMLADFHIAADARSSTSSLSQLNAWLLERHRTGETAVLIVDEAQGLPSHTIEEIRLLLNLETPTGKLLQIVLSGQSDLDERLKRLDLRPLHQRISLRCRTMPMTQEETRGCIQHRLRVAGAQDDGLFTPEAMDSAYFYSRGIPRIINLLCEQALLKAYCSGVRPVSASMIEDASREFQFDGDRPISPPPKTDAATALRASVIPMQSMLTNPPMSFAATAGSDADRRQHLTSLRPPAFPSKAQPPAVANNRDFDARKAVPARQLGVFPAKPQVSAKRANSTTYHSADVGQIIAELSAGAPAATPVCMNPGMRNRNPIPPTVRRSISWLVRAQALLLAFFAKTRVNFGRRTRRAMLSLRSNYRRWSHNCSVAAAPVIKRMTAPFISWLKQPRPPKLLIRATSRTSRRPSSRFTAVSSDLRNRAVRWLQTPLRPAHRR